MLSIPILLLIGIGLSLARRLPERAATPLQINVPQTAAPAPTTVPQTEAPAPTTVPQTEAPAPTTVPPATGQPPFHPFHDHGLSEPRRLFLARATTGLLGGAAVLAYFGLEEAEEAPLITRREVQLAGLHPDLDGLTVLQLSDIHAGALVTEERMARWAKAAAALGADLVVFTGDLLDGSGRAAGPFSRAFADVHGKVGTFSIFGNHDHYAGERYAERAMRDAGQGVLRNSGTRVVRGGGSLWLGGVDDPMGGVDLDAALAGSAPGETRVLLAHRPGLFDLCAEAGAQLVLSGHTHGGQIAVSPIFSPARLIGRYTMGHYQRGQSQLYVHRGMGVVSAMPLRLGAPPEIALLTLRRS
jgi:predicted MPP superfamily phosphohydrolase